MNLGKIYEGLGFSYLVLGPLRRAYFVFSSSLVRVCISNYNQNLELGFLLQSLCLRAEDLRKKKPTANIETVGSMEGQPIKRPNILTYT